MRAGEPGGAGWRPGGWLVGGLGPVVSVAVGGGPIPAERQRQHVESAHRSIERLRCPRDRRELSGLPELTDAEQMHGVSCGRHVSPP